MKDIPATLAPRVASVLYLRLVDGAPAKRLAAALDRALSGWPADQRLVLEADGAAAVIGLGGPVAVLEAARRAARKDGLLIALHHGPVQLVRQDSGMQAMGEAMDTAAAAAVAEEGRPALRTTPQFDQALAGARRLRLHMVGAAGVVGLLALGGLGRTLRQRWSQPQLATLQLEIRPSGEIWVDGDLKGSTPPLSRMRIAAGAHTLEVRNGRFKPLRMEIRLEPGEEMTIRHEFRAAPPPAASRGTPPWTDRLRDRLRDGLPGWVPK
ncbi:PEGA domain-containing protein [Ramlibacter tataouinensis]|uniref:PEGA domain-containing protein n=1 Tax=Ramlibacter tataouinensis (strain ATCC BAA-407 / DSM 14655 / LMG 21543 / TTB310) TaxID=365046 RepID=F5XXU8_RAMTT|nr:PEGA domain-containing protein [Ramlibacter tataouinensis]AEG93083.1 hypothetical protein Rta_19910 [Ramlibacter tataouinensis TTB310]